MDQSSMFYEGLFGSDSSESESESESPVLFGSLFGSSSSESESEYESEVSVFEFGSSPIIPPLLSPLRQTRPPTPLHLRTPHPRRHLSRYYHRYCPRYRPLEDFLTVPTNFMITQTDVLIGLILTG